MSYKFIEDDAETITRENIARFESIRGRTLYPGDPLRLIIQEFSYIQATHAAKVNDAANQSFVDHARSDSLNGLAVLPGVARRAAEAARTTLRFSLAAARAEVTLVPQGTRATVPGSAVYWATIEAAEIAAGDTYVDVIAEASVLGPSANGYLTGEISTLVDVVTFISSVSNISPSSDGSEAENDDSLKERIREAPTRFSVGGPEDAYITLTKDSRADVESVSINSPEPRYIDIYFTLTGGAVPAAETIAEVQAYLNDKYRRPMSDVVTVHAPTAVNYTISLAFYIDNGDSARAAETQTAILLAISDYVAWQKAEIGRDINPSELTRRVMNAGALRVVVTSPAYTELNYSQLAVLSGNPTITNGGLDDE